MKNVAKLANISIATVSRVLTGSDAVADETRKKGFSPTDFGNIKIF